MIITLLWKDTGDVCRGNTWQIYVSIHFKHWLRQESQQNFGPEMLGFLVMGL
jgi:hypothetical protein